MTADEVMARVVAVYAGCDTYQDTGRVTIRYTRPGGPARTQLRPFDTAFARPDRLRFEYRSRFGDGPDDWHRHLAWADGADVRSWWDIRPGVERHESLAHVLADLTGVSGGSAHTIPALLLPDMDGPSWLTRLTGLAVTGEEEIDGAECVRLTGTRPVRTLDPEVEERHRAEVFRVTGSPPERATSGPVSVWVDRATFLVRRIAESTAFETFATESVTEYDPVVDGPVDEWALRFDPPD